MPQHRTEPLLKFIDKAQPREKRRMLAAQRDRPSALAKLLKHGGPAIAWLQASVLMGPQTFEMTDAGQRVRPTVVYNDSAATERPVIRDSECCWGRSVECRGKAVAERRQQLQKPTKILCVTPTALQRKIRSRQATCICRHLLSTAVAKLI